MGCYFTIAPYASPTVATGNAPGFAFEGGAVHDRRPQNQQGGPIRPLILSQASGVVDKSAMRVSVERASSVGLRLGRTPSPDFSALPQSRPESDDRYNQPDGCKGEKDQS